MPLQFTQVADPADFEDTNTVQQVSAAQDPGLIALVAQYKQEGNAAAKAIQLLLDSAAAQQPVQVEAMGQASGPKQCNDLQTRVQRSLKAVCEAEQTSQEAEDTVDIAYDELEGARECRCQCQIS